MNRFITALAILLVAALPARAQTAPEGNAHPETRALSREAAELPNPFGEPSMREIAPTDRKLALRSGVNLAPLRDLAVQHNGRVKILDTLARETVARITGRRNYQDFVPADGKVKVVSYDPLFTLLDLTIDPAYYLDKPLIHVEFLPLRRAFVEAAFPGDEATQERWMRFTRLSPIIILQHGAEIQNRYDTQLPYRTSLTQVAVALELFREGAANLLLVAPDHEHEEYLHLSTLPDSSPARAAARELGDAWRAGDAQRVNAAIATLAAELPRINPQVYPTTRRAIEATYNRVNAFEWGYWAYAFSLVTLLLAFGTGRRVLIGAGIAFLTLAVGLHAFGFIARCIIAERFAIQNQFESMTGVSLFGCLVGLAIMIAKRQWLFGAAAAGVGFLVLITATQTAIPGKFIEREAAILNTSVLLKYHVTTVLCSYGLIALGFIISLFYLGTHYAAALRSSWQRTQDAGPGTQDPIRTQPFAGAAPLAAAALNLDESKPAGVNRTLADLDKAQMTVLQLAFWTLGVGILLGAWWADHSWGRWWAFDPKETWALVTWIIYLIVIHIRFATLRNRALVTAWLSVLGFIVMLWTYFGVNLLLPGLHAYA